jgi:signal recognition particle receptor subunit beta
MAAVAVVAGDFGAGKSSLVNAIAGIEACPVDPLDATTVLTAVRAGRPGASVRLSDAAPGEVVALDHGSLAEWLTEGGNPGNRRGVEIADVAVDSEVLAEGLVLVDTPGIGGMHPGLVRAVTELLPSADAIVLALDAGAPPTRETVAMLAEAAGDGLEVIVALTKTDIHPEWRAVAARTSAVLREAGIPAAVVPIAVPLAPDADAGVAGLVAELRRRLVGPARRRMETGALEVAGQVAAELARREPDPDAERRQAALAEGRRRWAAMLQEGFADVTVDLDGEVRAGLVRLGASIDEVVGSVDPGKEWPQVRAAVDDGAADLVRSLSARLASGSQAVASSIADVFGAPGALDVAAVDLGLAMGSVDGDAPESGASQGAVSRGLDVLRGSYGGIVLAGVLGQLVALPLAAPIALGAGAVFGVRQVTDQRRKKVEQRRTSARKVVRAHLDETGARLGSAVRKAVQAAQRDVRDGVEALVADLEAGPSHGEDVSAEAGALLAAIRAEERDR